MAVQIQQADQGMNISHIVEFIKVKARAANNPVFGSEIGTAHDRMGDSSCRSKAKGGPSPIEHATTFTTQVTNHSRKDNSSSNNDKPSARFGSCPTCNGTHSLAKCQTFERKTFEECLKITRNAHLCHNCFKYGHIAVGCLAKKACQVDGCKRRHHTLLHPPAPCQPEPSVSRAKVAEAGIQVSDSPLQGGQTNNTSAGGGNVCLRIVPVKVQTHDASKTVERYALLDSGLDISLREKELAVELGVQGDQKTFYLTTQEREDSPKVGEA